MANKGGHNSGGSQFFIIQQDSPGLDGRYSVFGRVVEGIEVVDAITEVEIDTYGRYGPTDRPYPVPVVIESVRIERADVAGLPRSRRIDRPGPVGGTAANLRAEIRSCPVMYTLEIDESEQAHAQAASRPIAWPGAWSNGSRDAAEALAEGQRAAGSRTPERSPATPRANPRDSAVRRALRLRSSAGRRPAGRTPAT